MFTIMSNISFALRRNKRALICIVPEEKKLITTKQNKVSYEMQEDTNINNKKKLWVPQR